MLDDEENNTWMFRCHPIKKVWRCRQISAQKIDWVQRYEQKFFFVKIGQKIAKGPRGIGPYRPSMTIKLTEI